MGNICIYEKNKLDLDFEWATITVTDATASDTGSSYVSALRDRSNFTGWGTTDSNDAANTQLDIDLKDEYEIDRIFAVNHNFKAYTIQYWNGSSYVDFSPAINVSGNTSTTKFHRFQNVNARLIRMIITSAAQVNDGVISSAINFDKLMSQLIITRKIGEFKNQPEIKPFTFDADRRALKLVSGKSHISEKASAARLRLAFEPYKDQNDINLIKDIFESFEGRLFSFVGEDDSQIEMQVPGFRNRDLLLMRPTNNLDVSFNKGFYSYGQINVLDLVEAR